MKKILGFLTLACTLFATVGCSGSDKGAIGGTDHFKEYTFVGTANTEQTAKIYEGLQNALQNVSSMSGRTEEYSKSGSTRTAVKNEVTIKLYEDSTKPDQVMLIRTTSGSNESTSNGIILNTKSKGEYRVWDGGVGYSFALSKTTNNGISNENVTFSEISGTSKAYKNSVISSYFSVPNANTYYINSDGSYTVINSSINKEVTGIQWGDGTKEYIVASKSQTVYSISKDYRLTSYYSYSERSSNRDQETGEWFSSAQIYYRAYTSGEYKYGKRDSSSISTFNALIKDKTFTISSGLSSYSATVLSDNTIEQESKQSNSISCSQVSSSGTTKRYRFYASISGGSSYDGRYAARRFVFGEKTLHGADQIVSNERELITNPNTITSSSFYDYFRLQTINNHLYIVNISSYSYYELEITFDFDGTNANIYSINLY